MYINDSSAVLYTHKICTETVFLSSLFSKELLHFETSSQTICCGLLAAKVALILYTYEKR
jgi:hypothetical protein